MLKCVYIDLIDFTSEIVGTNELLVNKIKMFFAFCCVNSIKINFHFVLNHTKSRFAAPSSSIGSFNDISATKISQTKWLVGY